MKTLTLLLAFTALILLYPTVSSANDARSAYNQNRARQITPTPIEYVENAIKVVNTAEYIGDGNQKQALLTKLKKALKYLKQRPADRDGAVKEMNKFLGILCVMKDNGKLGGRSYNSIYTSYLYTITSLGQSPERCD